VFQKVVRSAQLISLPNLYFQLKELIDSPDYTMAEVAILVGRDPAMSTRFLRFVNNPLNRRTCRIETVSHAVSLLGIRQVHDIVLGASVAEAFNGIKNDVMNMSKFWHLSFYCAVLTKQLAMACDELESDRLFLAGLLHDLGHLFMYIAIPEECQQIMQTSKERNQPLYQTEREVLGFDYAAVGAHMMEQWGLPDSIYDMTRFHPEPSKSTDHKEEAALLHLSALLVRSDLEELDFGEGALEVDPIAWSSTGLAVDQCHQLRQIAADQFKEVADALFSGN